MNRRHKICIYILELEFHHGIKVLVKSVSSLTRVPWDLEGLDTNLCFVESFVSCAKGILRFRLVIQCGLNGFVNYVARTLRKWETRAIQFAESFCARRPFYALPSFPTYSQHYFPGWQTKASALWLRGRRL